MNFVYTALLFLFSYTVGSVPTGYWLVKILKGIDIREVGSGSTGATNVLRTAGRAAGLTVFLIDILKGIIPVAAALWLSNNTTLLVSDQYSILPVVMAIAALIGHSRSIFLKFQGGKSAATGLGSLFALDWRVGLLTLITFASGCAIYRIVSLASLTAVFLCIFYMALLKAPIAYVGYCIVGFAYITFRHKSNIQRLLKGTEPKIGDKPKV
jgi:acyl phosphate:glycerol-3-phosphate acyltransferase